MAAQIKMHRKFEMIEQLIEMKTKRQFLEQKIMEYQNRIKVLDDFIAYVDNEIKEAEKP